MSICPLTGQNINLLQPNPSVMEFYYETLKTGKIRISDVALASAGSLSPEEKQILTGICRNQTIKEEEPFMIKYAFFQQLNSQDIPYSFEDRAKHLLQYLYNNGGKEYRKHNLNSDKDSPITYSSRDEFERIMDFLEGESWINYDTKTPTNQCVFYQGLRISKSGIQEIENKSQKVENSIEGFKKLNEVIDKIENKLRDIVVKVLIEGTGKEDFESLLTGEAKQQVRRRIEQFIDKHPNQTKEDFKLLKKSIQFCDIEHLKKVIIKDEYWTWFESIFQDKSKVERYFNQFSEIRHVVKHTREMTTLILHEGKAAIEWFEMIQSN
jgi:hypothetical protein